MAQAKTTKTEAAAGRCCHLYRGPAGGLQEIRQPAGPYPGPAGQRGKRYTLDEVDRLIESYMKGQVK